MDRAVLMAIVVVFMLALLALMVWGWRSRQKRQQGVARPRPVPAEQGRVLGSFAGKYVATTASGDALDRLAVHGLGFRGAVFVDVTDAGLVVRRPGSDDFWIPAADLRDLGNATWTIDRVVEKDGLDLVEWTLGDRVVDSYFRMNEPKAFQNAVAELRTTERPTL